MSVTLEPRVDGVTVDIKVNSTVVATLVAAGMTVPGTLGVDGNTTLALLHVESAVIKTTATTVTCTVVNTWYAVANVGTNPQGLIIFRDGTSAGLALYGVQIGGVLEFGTGSIGNFEVRQTGAGAGLEVRVTGGTTPRSIQYAMLEIGTG